MSDVKLGVAPPVHSERDAIHVAVIPVVAGQQLSPGEHVGRLADGTFGNTLDRLLGVVDPFLKQLVEKGQTFWLVLYPNSISGMRHHWSPPAFPMGDGSNKRSESEAWLRDYANKHNPYYENEERAFRHLIRLDVQVRTYGAMGTVVYGKSL